jgi:hypothetical protein
VNPERTSLISAAGKIIRDLVSQPFRFSEETEDEAEGTIYAHPLAGEMPIDNGRPSLYPPENYLQDGVRFLQSRTFWAIDGGILTWQFPNGLLLIGRAVVSRMTFSGYESVQRVFDVPIVPFIVYAPIEGDSTPLPIEELSKDYLQHVLGTLPQLSSRERSRSVAGYFSDAEQFLASIPESYYAGAATRSAVARYIDQIRDAAETVAFIYALRNAGPRDVVMRDGRIHGGAGFLTRLVKDSQSSEESEQGNLVVRTIIESISSAVDHGVRVLGIIKHPRSSYCTNWYSEQGIQFAKYVASDALLYYRAIEPMPSERTQRIYGAGKRSCLWKIRESGYGERHQLEEAIEPKKASGRGLVHWFYQNTGCFFIKAKEGVLPIRVDFILHNNHYRSWFADNLSEQIYSLCTGSGSPFGLPQPIVIADGYAKVHQPELARSINGLIADFENSTVEEDRRIARELRAYLDIYYRGAVA